MINQRRMLPGPSRRTAMSPSRVPWWLPSARLVIFITGILVGAFAVTMLSNGSSMMSMRRSLTAMAGRSGSSKYLVATSTSCEDIVPPKPWITNSEGKYDVVVFDYSANHSCKQYIKPHKGLSLYHRPKTFKWPAMNRYFTEDETRSSLSAYSHFLLTDDDVDVEGDAAGVLRLFQICDEYGFHICQPSLSAKSSVNMDVTAHVDALDPPTAVGRETKFVEQMSPLFSREALMMFLPYFKGQTHAWGIDTLWSDLSHRIDRRIGVIDAVQIDHMRPSGVSGLYKRVGGLEKAAADQKAFRDKYGVRDEFFEMVKPGHKGEGVPVVAPR